MGRTRREINNDFRWYQGWRELIEFKIRKTGWMLALVTGITTGTFWATTPNESQWSDLADVGGIVGVGGIVTMLLVELADRLIWEKQKLLGKEYKNTDKGWS